MVPHPRTWYETQISGNAVAAPRRERSLAISTKVFVGNLNFRTTEQQLADALSAAGQVTHVHMGTDRETGRSRGFAFVEFSSEAEAAEAIRRFDGQEVDGRKLRVNTADDRPRRTDGPRPAGPRGDRPSFIGSTPGRSEGAWSGFGSGGGFGPDAGGRQFKNKGSRRGLRARKRSLNF
jgi:RNA recognition motif-containing protein